MLKMPRKVDPLSAIVDAEIRLPYEEVLAHFKEALPRHPANAPFVVVRDYGFTKMVFFPQSQTIHFLSNVTQLKNLVEGLRAYTKACKVPRFNSLNLATVLINFSFQTEYSDAQVRKLDLESLNWNVFQNRSSAYTL